MATHSLPLTAAFANGWRLLSTELKLEVMSNVLPCDEVLKINILTEASRERKKRLNSDTTDVQLLWCLLEHPDFCDVAVSTLSKITFLIRSPRHLDQHLRDMPRYKPPAPSITPHVQRIQVKICATSDDWVWLANLGRNFNFSSLREVSISITHDRYCGFYQKHLRREIRKAGVIVWDAQILRVRFRFVDKRMAGARDELKALVKGHLLRREDMQA